MVTVFGLYTNYMYNCCDVILVLY